MDNFIDSKRGVEIVTAFIVWAVCLMAANQAALFTPETNKNLAGLAAGAFVAIIEWKREFGEIIARNPQVEAIASGHTHRDSALRWNGTVVYVTPSCTFSYKLEFNEVDDLDPLLEPAACRIFRWDKEVGLVSHLDFIGSYEYGISEGVPEPPQN